eukprot:snap_masked-scaffold_25-processed-gene-2.48-mRNA-1 protein AED:1.00 eAED:1.00 QI:0/-1/0/0/-1/1/1/0/442
MSEEQENSDLDFFFDDFSSPAFPNVEGYPQMSMELDPLESLLASPPQLVPPGANSPILLQGSNFQQNIPQSPAQNELRQQKVPSKSLQNDFAKNIYNSPSFPNFPSANKIVASSSGAKTAKSKLSKSKTHSKSTPNLIQSTSDEKRQRRLERNRESARQSRRRKKQALLDVEDRVVSLTQELDKERNNFLKRYFENKEENKKSLLEQVLNKVNEPNIDLKNLEELLEEYEKTFSVFNEEELELFDYHFEHVVNLLMPNYAKYFMWLVNRHRLEQHNLHLSNNSRMTIKSQSTPNLRDVENCTDCKSEDIFDQFCMDLGLSKVQKEKIRSDFKQQLNHHHEHKRLNLIVSILGQCRSAFEVRRKTIKTQKRAVFDVLDPVHKAKVLTKQLEENTEEEEKKELDMLKREFAGDTTMMKTLKLLEKKDEEVDFDDLKFLLHVVNR